MKNRELNGRIEISLTMSGFAVGSSSPGSAPGSSCTSIMWHLDTLHHNHASAIIHHGRN